MSWFISSSGRASARPTVTWFIGRSSSSATIIVIAVVMPWPTSARGTAKNAVPSGLIRTEISPAVGAAARFCMSPRSKMSSGWGSVGIEACARPEPAQSTATARVGAASR